MIVFHTEAPDHKLSWKTFSKRNFDLEQVISMFRMLTCGVQHMHDKGLILRDLHPTRIHISDGCVKWNLIGMPYNFKKLVRSATFTGHLNYTAPELFKDESGDSLSKAADIFALGCVLFFVVTRRDPFTVENPKENLDKIKENILKGIVEDESYKNLDWRGIKRHVMI